MSLRDLDDELRSHRQYLERTVASIDPAEWKPRPGDGFRHVIQKHGLDSFVGYVSMHHPLEYLAFVRGLCAGALTRFFERTENQIPLARGLPVPFAKRPIHALFDATPPPEKISNRELLAPIGYEFFRHQRGGFVSTTLDFRHRDRLDAIT